MKEIKPSQLRKAVARVLSEGVAIPRASCDVSVDASALLPIVKNHGLKMEAIFLSAIAEIIYCEMPHMNTRWSESVQDPEPKIFLFNTLDFGLATESKNGLAVVTVRDIEHKNLWQLNSEIKELAAIAAEGKLKTHHFEPKPNIVFNNIGVYPDIIDGSPLLQSCNTFMVSAFRARETPVAYKGQVMIRPIMNVKFTFDHRPVDGKDAARFLGKLKNALENPRY